MGLPSKLGDALLSAIARDNVFSISYAIQQSILVNPAFQVFYAESAADMRSGHSDCETALGCKPVLMNVAHRQLITEGPFRRGFGEDPQPVESLPQLGMRGKRSLHDLQVARSGGHRIAYTRGGIPDHQVQAAQRAVSMQVADGVGLIAFSNYHGLRARQALRPCVARLLNQFFQ